jgi:hypothetical protein
MSKEVVTGDRSGTAMRGAGECVPKRTGKQTIPNEPLPPAMFAKYRKNCLPKRPDGKYDYAKAQRLWREAKKGRKDEHQNRNIKDTIIRRSTLNELLKGLYLVK